MIVVVNSILCCIHRSPYCTHIKALSFLLSEKVIHQLVDVDAEEPQTIVNILSIDPFLQLCGMDKAMELSINIE